MLSLFLKLAAFILLILYSLGHVVAQNTFPPLPYAQKPRIQAQRAQHQVVLDGVLDEEDWRLCQQAGQFLVCYPEQMKKPAFDTRVMVLYDSVNLYFGAICYYSGRKRSLQVQNMKRDFGFSTNELLSIFIEPFQNSRMPLPGFYVSPYGTQTDIMYYYGVAYDYNWDAVWNARTSIGDSAWTAEIAIPWSSLRYPRDSTIWSINFDRNIRDKGEYTSWSPWPLAYDPSHMAYGGLLTGIHPPHQDMNLRLQPYALVKTSRGDGQASSTRPAVGGEVKWALGANTVADVTVNTDFAQADVDKQVVNLTRSSVFFPEKRQFFKENANLFSVGEDNMLQPFFTRRIGLNGAGSPLTIDGGLRLIHQSDKQSAGLLLMRQEGDSTARPAWFNVLRYKRQVGKWQLGAMNVMRMEEGDGKVAGGAGAGDWNAVTSLDAYVRLSEAFYVRQMVSASMDKGLPVRGVASVTEVNYATNTVYASLFVTAAGKGYTAKAGFMERQDFIHTQPELQLFLRPGSLPGRLFAWLPAGVAFYNPIVMADIYHQTSTGVLQEMSSSVSPVGFLTRTGGEYRVNMLYAYENIGDVFHPVNGVAIAPGKYQFLRWELYGKTNQAAPYSLEARVSTGRYYNIWLNSYYAALRVVPIPHVAFGLGFTESHFSGVRETSGGTGTGTDPGSGAGGPGSGDGARATTKNTFLVAPELRLAWNARLQLSSFYQYNTDANMGALNVRLSWEYRPLSFVYLVVNSNSHLRGVAERQEMGILKVSYIRQL